MYRRWEIKPRETDFSGTFIEKSKFKGKEKKQEVIQLSATRLGQ